MSPTDFSIENVLVATFGEDAKNDTNAYQALTDLKQLDSQGQIHIIGAAVVTRDLDGRVEVKSEVGNDPYVGTASGGMIVWGAQTRSALTAWSGLPGAPMPTAD
jgi:uncharacterized membrane protein